MAKKVLFVDDDADWRSVVSTWLKDAGYDVVVAKDATEALDLAHGLDMGVIILDLNLAGESGIALMKYLKRNNPDVPVILYTGQEHDELQVQKMLTQGAHQYLKKGKGEELVKAVKRSWR